MEHSAVTEVEFGRFPLSFPDVFKPRLQASDDEGVFEDVEMVGDGGTAVVERLSEFGDIQEFAMEMSASSRAALAQWRVSSLRIAGGRAEGRFRQNPYARRGIVDRRVRNFFQ
jgi:hypothetical protein